MNFHKITSAAFKFSKFFHVIFNLVPGTVPVMSIACVEPETRSEPMCKRRKTEPEGYCAVATAFFQDNIEEDEDDEAFGTSSVPNLSEIAAETSETEEDAASVTELDDDGRDVASMTEVDEDEGGIDGDGLPAVDLGDPNAEYETLVEEPLETVEPEVAEDEMEEIAAEEEVEVTVEPEEELPPDVIDVPVDDFDDPDVHRVEQPRTPSTAQSESEDETVQHRPMHHSSVPPFSCLRDPGTPAPNARVSFVKLEVADGHLLADATGLREVIHLPNHRGLNLWFHSPGAAVQCSYCEGYWPQQFGSLTGNQTGSSFAQYEFVCQTCANANEAWLAAQAQEAATATSTPEITPEPTGPWDNPGSGWNDWANE